MRSVPNQGASSLERSDLPMLRHFAEPLDARFLHRHVRVETLGDGVGDDGVPLFLQQLDQPLLLSTSLRKNSATSSDNGTFSVSRMETSACGLPFCLPLVPSTISRCSSRKGRSTVIVR